MTDPQSADGERVVAQSAISFGESNQIGSVAISGDVAGRDLVKLVVQLPQPTPALSNLHQLRAPTRDFVGRASEIAKLETALSAASVDGAVASISGVTGMGGIGKTELAMMVANRLTNRFPDAQIVVDLQGSHEPSLLPAQALAAVVRALEPEAKQPDDLPSLLNLYHNVLAGKRVLLLADDARDAAQVRPLVPPVGCALLVTSRNRFTLPGMGRVDLERLGSDDAVRLLQSICDRLSDDEAGQIAQRCDYLPLALRISGGVLANDETLSVARYLARLADQRKQLAALRDPDDPELDVGASIALSYALLQLHEQRSLRWLSVFITSFDRAAAASVLQTDDEDALDDVLGLLHRRNLLEYNPANMRYDLHDLVRAFAMARLGDEERPARLRHAAHYIAVAKEAERLYLAGNQQVALGLALFDRERTQLDAARSWLQTCAADPEVDALLIEDAGATVYIGDLRYPLRTGRIPQLEAALAAARRSGDRAAQGRFLSTLGLAYTNVGEARTAISFYEQGLVIAREIGDRRAEGNALGNMGSAYATLGEMRTAISFYEQSLVIVREIGNRRGEGIVLNSLGLAYTDMGEARTGISFHEQRLAIVREMGDRRGEGISLGNLGIAYDVLGEARTAISFYEQHLVIAREIGDRRGEGAALGNLGLAYANVGEARTAISFYEQALVIAREIGQRRGEGAALGNLCMAYADLGEARTALSFYEQHVAVARAIGDRQGEAETSWYYGKILLREGERERGIALMQVCLDFEQEIGHADAEKHAALLQHLRAGGTLEDSD